MQELKVLNYFSILAKLILSLLFWFLYFIFTFSDRVACSCFFFFSFCYMFTWFYNLFQTKHCWVYFPDDLPVCIPPPPSQEHRLNSCSLIYWWCRYKLVLHVSLTKISFSWRPDLHVLVLLKVLDTVRGTWNLGRRWGQSTPASVT